MKKDEQWYWTLDSAMCHWWLWWAALVRQEVWARHGREMGWAQANFRFFVSAKQSKGSQWELPEKTDSKGFLEQREVTACVYADYSDTIERLKAEVLTEFLAVSTPTMNSSTKNSLRLSHPLLFPHLIFLSSYFEKGQLFQATTFLHLASLFPFSCLKGEVFGKKLH